jgi:hypothetical protein
MGLYSDSMGYWWDNSDYNDYNDIKLFKWNNIMIYGIYNIFNGIYNDLVGFYSDSMGYWWDINGIYHLVMTFTVCHGIDGQ